MITSIETNRILNRCLKSAETYYKEEGTLFPMLILLKKGDPFSVEIENKSVVLIRNDEEGEEIPAEYISDDGTKISVSFVLFKRKTTEDDRNLSLASKELVKKYDPDVVALFTTVASKEDDAEISTISFLYISYYTKGSKDVMRMYIPYINRGEFPVDKKETVMVHGELKTINYDVIFIDTSWTDKEIYTHFFKNPY